ncbi:family 16 glycosylhydrolase [Couchioplanes azureus]|uniref:family 16 glycosylhydrolase n=1 Tax=Couchioplanes caeruleus TaxID=56438 RepID=UPI001670AAB6|nr:family 16 glycosylhydrolase [Couchioplanes caeruleus]
MRAASPALGAPATRTARLTALANLLVLGATAALTMPDGTQAVAASTSPARTVRSAQATTADLVEIAANGSAATSLTGWTVRSQSGGVTINRVTGLAGAFPGTTGVRISRSGGTGTWAYALTALKSPQTAFVVGRTYTMSGWVRDLTGSGRPIGLLLGNANYQHRPTTTAEYTKFTDTGWHYVSRTFVCTAPGFADTAFYLGLPANGSFDFQLTGLSVRAAAMPAPARSAAPPSTVVAFAGAAGTAPDARTWNYEIGGHGWGNGEAQTYTSRASNVRLDGTGKLRITARRETLTGPDGVTRKFTSARITTKGKLAVAPGSYLEASITAPTGTGLWPAFWLLGTNIDKVGWPASGELDIFEGVGSRPTMAHSAAHMAAAGNPRADFPYGWGEAGGSTDLGEPLDARSHTYGVYFDAHTVRFYIDRKPTMTLWAADALATGRTWPFTGSQYVILNVAVSGEVDTSATAFPREMAVGPISIWNTGLPF